MEKRIRAIRTVEKSTINIKEGTLLLFPKEGRHIEIDAVKKAVENAGFTPREVWVALIGKLVKWKDKTVLSIVSTDKKGEKTETIYLLKENQLLRKLKASVKLPSEEIFIAGEAVKVISDEDKGLIPETIIVEKYLVLSKEKN